MVNYLLILMITSIIFILKRKKTFYFLISFIVLGISSISNYLFKVRGVPFTFSDIYSIGEGMEIAGNYLDVKMITGIVVGLGLVLGTLIYLFKKRKEF